MLPFLTNVAIGFATPAAICGLLTAFVKFVPIPMTRYSTDLLSNTVSVAFEATSGLFDLVCGYLGLRAGWALLLAYSLGAEPADDARFGAFGWGRPEIEPAAGLLDSALGFHFFATILIWHQRPLLGDKEQVIQSAMHFGAMFIARILCLPPIYIAALFGAQIAGFPAWLQRLGVRLGFTPTDDVGLFTNGLSLASIILFRVVWYLTFVAHSMWNFGSVVRAQGFLLSVLSYIPFVMLGGYNVLWLYLTIQQLNRWYGVDKKTGKLRFKRIPSRGNLLTALGVTETDASPQDEAGGGSKRFRVPKGAREGTPRPAGESSEFSDSEWDLLPKDGYVSEGFDDVTMRNKDPVEGFRTKRREAKPTATIQLPCGPPPGRATKPPAPEKNEKPSPKEPKKTR